MALVYGDRVKEVSTTTGTGTYTLSGASTGYQTFAAGVGSGATTNYCATDGVNWEVGYGTLTVAGSTTLTRTTILASSNSGSAVNWGAGTRTISCVMPAQPDPVAWTPVLTFATPGTLSVAYSTQSGSYTRTFNEIDATFYIDTSSFTLGTASGNLRITGLPYTAVGTIAVGSMLYSGVTKAGYHNMVPQILSGEAYITPVASGSGVATAAVTASDTPSGGTVILRGHIRYTI
jgi:hypothetical protein